MPPRPILNDALWRCLCPRFSLRCLPVSFSPLSRTASHGASLHPRYTPQLCLSRAFSSTGSPSPLNGSSSSSSSRDSFIRSRKPRQRSSQRPHDMKKPSLVQLSTPCLYEHLRIAGAEGRYEETMKIVNVLIKDRRQRPNKEMYAAILHSFVDCEEGTAGKVRKTLEEMGFWDDNGEGMKVELDARGCECALEALTVHPDYLLRNEILNYMKVRWFTLSDRGHNFIVAGFLRDRNLEQALEKLEEMIKNRTRIEAWLWDKTIWLLLEFGEVEEAFFVLGLREGVEGRDGRIGSLKTSKSLWAALLDAAASKQLHEATNMVWMSQVQPAYLKPPTGTCLSTLALASRHGDVNLATDVFRVLTERETIFNTHHYELLIATYLKVNDLRAALSVILIMADAGLKVDAGTCHPLYWHLRNENEGEGNRSMEAFTLLQEMVGRKVPTAVPNACIQASISLNRLEEALEIYKALHLVAPSGPNTQTFNFLFQGCSKHGRKDLAMHLVNEMFELGLKPDRLTYDRLILVCIQSGDMHDALLYYEEMRGQHLRPRRGTYETLIRNTAEKGDDRAVAILKDYQESGEMVSRGVEKAVKAKFEDKSVAGMSSIVEGNCLS